MFCCCKNDWQFLFKDFGYIIYYLPFDYDSRVTYLTGGTKMVQMPINDQNSPNDPQDYPYLMWPMKSPKDMREPNDMWSHVVRSNHFESCTPTILSYADITAEQQWLSLSIANLRASKDNSIIQVVTVAAILYDNLSDNALS